MKTLVALLASGILFLAGCAAQMGQPDYVTGCMLQIDPPGAYEYPAGQAIPTVTPGPGGTQEGADAVNACILAEATAAEGAMSRPVGLSDDSVAFGKGKTSGGAFEHSAAGSATYRLPYGAACPPDANVLHRGTLYCLVQ